MIDISQCVKKYPNALERRDWLASSLHDMYPETANRRDINLLLMAFDCGIVSRVRGKKTVSWDVTDSVAARMEDEYGVARALALPAIEAWCVALGAKVMGESGGSAPAPQPKSTPVSLTKPVAPGVRAVPPKGAPMIAARNPNEVRDHNGFVATRGDDGRWFISRFTGFIDDEIVVPSVIDGQKISGIDNQAFQNLRKVKRVSIEDGITYIGSRAFCRSDALISVRFPETLLSVKDHAFFACSHLAINRLPESLTSIGDYSFGLCAFSGDIRLPQRLKSIGEGAFLSSRQNKGKCSWYLPANIAYVGRAAFAVNTIESFHFAQGEASELTGTIFRPNTQNKPNQTTSINALFIPETVTRIRPDFLNPISVKCRILYCEPGSAAHEYARNRSIPFARAYFGPDCPYGRPA